jgi:hypothetical protein
MRTPVSQKKRKAIPFDFVIDAIDSLDPYTKPMFGCTAVYVDTKIVFVLRDRNDHVEDNGIWVATTPEHHKSLKKEFSSMRSLAMFGPQSTGWQVLPSDSADFEEAALKICDMVIAKDPRVGKVPNVKTRKSF